MVGSPGTAFTSMCAGATFVISCSGTSTDEVPRATSAVICHAPSSERLPPVAVKIPGPDGARSRREPPTSERAGTENRSVTWSAATVAPVS